MDLLVLIENTWILPEDLEGTLVFLLENFGSKTVLDDSTFVVELLRQSQMFFVYKKIWYLLELYMKFKEDI